MVLNATAIAMIACVIAFYSACHAECRALLQASPTFVLDRSQGAPIGSGGGTIVIG